MIEIRLSALKQSKPHEYFVRFLFGGACTVAAGLIAKKFGPAIGGLFLAFPAIFPASASLIESHERAKKREIGSDGKRRGRTAAGSEAAGTAIGCIGLLAFGFATWKLLPKSAAVVAIGIASILWTIVVLALWGIRKKRFFTRSHK